MTGYISMRDMALQIHQYYATVNNSSLSKRYQRVYFPCFKSGYNNQKIVNPLNEKSYHPKFKTGKSWRPWKKRTGKPRTKQEPMDKPLHVLKGHRSGRRWNYFITINQDSILFGKITVFSINDGHIFRKRFFYS